MRWFGMSQRATRRLGAKSHLGSRRAALRKNSLAVALTALVLFLALLAFSPRFAAAGGALIAAAGAIFAVFAWLYPQPSRGPNASAKRQSPSVMIEESLPSEHMSDHDFRTTRERWNTLELQFTKDLALGRELEIAQLNEAWATNQTHVLLLIAPSGVGKTALVNEWLRSFSDPTRVFAWSFNNRSASEAALIGSEFLQAAFEWVRDPTPSRGSGWIRGERLAGFLREKPTLLVLDGLESLMLGDDAGPSAIADPAVYALLMDLAQDNNGLCVVTAQRSIAELADAENVRVLDLEDISSEAGRDILRAEGIRSKGVHLEDIASVFGPNALALQLLAAFLLAHPNVDVMKMVAPSVLDGRIERPYARWVLDGLSPAFRF